LNFHEVSLLAVTINIYESIFVFVLQCSVTQNEMTLIDHCMHA
jgi:hypothetical protein